MEYPKISSLVEPMYKNDLGFSADYSADDIDIDNEIEEMEWEVGDGDDEEEEKEEEEYDDEEGDESYEEQNKEEDDEVEKASDDSDEGDDEYSIDGGKSKAPTILNQGRLGNVMRDLTLSKNKGEYLDSFMIGNI